MYLWRGRSAEFTQAQDQLVDGCFRIGGARARVVCGEALRPCYRLIEPRPEAIEQIVGGFVVIGHLAQQRLVHLVAFRATVRSPERGTRVAPVQQQPEFETGR